MTHAYDEEDLDKLADALLAEWDTPEFKHGYSVGESFGAYDTYKEAHRAYQLGEIDLWFAYQKPKTIEEWKEWEQKYGENFSDRWKDSPTNSEDETHG